MDKENYDNKQYTAADIQKYLDGKLSPHEMHLMEKAALEDPFLADAIDGFGIESSVKNAEHLAELEERLEKRQSQANVIPFYKNTLVRLVAAFVLLAAGVTLVYKLLFNPPVKQIALSTKEASNSALPAVKADTEIAYNAGANIPAPEVLSRSTSNKPLAPTKLKYTVKPPAKELYFSTESELVKVSDSSIATRSKQAPAKSKSIKMEDPIPGFSAARTERQVTAPAPAEMKKREAIPDSIYRNRELSEDKISDQNLSKSRQKDSKTGPVTNPIFALTGKSGAVPSGGEEAYRLYIKDNIKISEVGKAVHGIVSLQFTVSAAGQPTNIKITKSLGVLADKEAIRLIKEGPLWKQVGDDPETTVTISF